SRRLASTADGQLDAFHGVQGEVLGVVQASKPGTGMDAVESAGFGYPFAIAGNVRLRLVQSESSNPRSALMQHGARGGAICVPQADDAERCVQTAKRASCAEFQFSSVDAFVGPVTTARRSGMTHSSRHAAVARPS